LNYKSYYKRIYKNDFGINYARKIEVLLDKPKFLGFHYGSTILKDVGRKSISLSFRNCV